MNNVKESYAILGLSKFGYRMGVSLYQAGATVLAVDQSETLIHKISDDVTKAVVADLTDFEALEHIGVFDVGVAVIGLRRSFDVAVLLTHRLRRQPKIKKIVAQVDTEEKAEALRILGADLVVFAEKDIADRVVSQLLVPNLVEMIPLSEKAAIIEVPVPRSFIEMNMIDLQIRQKFNVYVIGIKNEMRAPGQPEVAIAPPPTTQFKEGDVMLVLGELVNLERFVGEVNESRS